MWVAVVAALCLACAFAGDECNITVDSVVYDLSTLSHIAGDREILYYRLEDGGMIYVNFCEHTTVVCPDTTSACVLTPDYQYVDHGDTNTAQGTPLECKDCGSEGITVTFTSQTQCQESSVCYS